LQEVRIGPGWSSREHDRSDSLRLGHATLQVMRIPDFLVRQFYVAGSLQHEGNGFRVQARNGMGDGTLVGVGNVTVDGELIDPTAITASLEGEEVVHYAADISPRSPVSFSRGDVVTFHIAGHPLTPGEHRFEVNVYEVNLGLLSLSLKDEVRPADR
jgi:hypothetical protein